MDIDNNIKIFSLMAGIEKPWVLEKTTLDDNKDLHMYGKHLFTIILYNTNCPIVM